jgi:hypothetical protein
MDAWTVRVHANNSLKKARVWPPRALVAGLVARTQLLQNTRCVVPYRRGELARFFCLPASFKIVRVQQSKKSGDRVGAARPAVAGEADTILHCARSLTVAKHGSRRHVLHAFGRAGTIDAPRFACDDRVMRLGPTLLFTHFDKPLRQSKTDLCVESVAN